MPDSMKSRFIVQDKQHIGGSLSLVERINSVVESGLIPASISIVPVSSFEQIDRVKKSAEGTVDVVIRNGSETDLLPERDSAIISLGTKGFINKDPSDNRPILVLPSRPSKEVLTQAMYGSIIQGSSYLSERHLEENSNTLGFFGLGQASYATVSRILERNRISDNPMNVLFSEYEGENFGSRFKQIKKRFQDQIERFDVVSIEDLTNAGIITIAASRTNEQLSEVDYGNPRYNMFRNGNAELVREFFDEIEKSPKAFMPIYLTVTNDNFLTARELLELSSNTGRLWKVFTPAELDRKRLYDTLTNEIERGFLDKPKQPPAWLIGQEQSEFRISGTHSSPIVLHRSSKVYDRHEKKLLSLQRMYDIGTVENKKLGEIVQKEADEWAESGLQPDEYAETNGLMTIDNLVDARRGHIGLAVTLDGFKIKMNPTVEDVKEGRVRFLTAYANWPKRGVAHANTNYRAIELRLIKEILDSEDRVYRSIIEEIYGTSTLA